MKFEHRCFMPFAAEKLWPYLADVQQTALCIPGMESVKPVGPNSWVGKVRVHLGLFSIGVDGTIRLIASDPAARRLVLSIEAEEKRLGGGLRGTVTAQLEGNSPNSCLLVVESDLATTGTANRLGDTAVQNKAKEAVEQFAENLKQKAA